MCNFFSLLSDGKGNIFYLDAKQRKDTKEKYDSPDSHTSIADYYGFKGLQEDEFNKWEYNPLTKILTLDHRNTEDDCVLVTEKCRNLDFRTIEPLLIVKTIKNPLYEQTEVTDADIDLLRQWIAVKGSIEANNHYNFSTEEISNITNNLMRDIIGITIQNYIRESILSFIWDIIWCRDSFIRDAIWLSLSNKIKDSDSKECSNLWEYVQASTLCLTWSYISSFFTIKYQYNFSSIIKLRERGLIPSFDGTTWRLHGYKGKILWEEQI